MVTIKKIAELANVSRGTVDRVIHKRGNYSATAEKLVKQVLEKVNYKPNVIAQSLVAKRPVTFGVFIPESDQDEKYWELPYRGIRKAEKELEIYKIKIIYFYYSKNSKSSFENCFEKVLKEKNKLNGLLIAPSTSAFTKKEVIKKMPSDLPYVFFDSYVPESNCISYIGQDSIQSGAVAAKLMNLLTRDNDEIAVIRMVSKDYHIDDRIKGFLNYTWKKEIKIKNYVAKNNAFITTFEKIFHGKNAVKGVFVPSAGSWRIAEYIKNDEIKDKVHIIGYDLTAKNKFYLKSGEIDFILSQRPEIQGYEGVMTLFKHIVLKESVSKKQMIPTDILIKENLTG